MPKVKFHPLIKELHGTMDNIVFRTLPNADIIASRRPDMSRVKWSKAQKAQRGQFSRANEYAKAAMADPSVRALYETMAAEQNKHPYRLAFSDYFKGNDLFAKK